MRALFVIVAVIACLLGAIVSLPFVPEGRLREVKPGMTEAEVLHLMGEPYGRGTPSNANDTYYWTWSTWSARVLIVQFSKDGRVVNVFTD